MTITTRRKRVAQLEEKKREEKIEPWSLPHSFQSNCFCERKKGQERAAREDLRYVGWGGLIERAEGSGTLLLAATIGRSSITIRSARKDLQADMQAVTRAPVVCLMANTTLHFPPQSIPTPTPFVCVSKRRAHSICIEQPKHKRRRRRRRRRRRLSKRFCVSTDSNWRQQPTLKRLPRVQELKRKDNKIQREK